MILKVRAIQDDILKEVSLPAHLYSILFCNFSFPSLPSPSREPISSFWFILPLFLFEKLAIQCSFLYLLLKKTNSDIVLSLI